MKKKIAVIGAGIAGLSVAYFLKGFKDITDLSIDIFESSNEPGGIIRSIQIGNMEFQPTSHYLYNKNPDAFNFLSDLTSGMQCFKNFSFVYYKNKYYRYPIQNHLYQFNFRDRMKFILSSRLKLEKNSQVNVNDFLSSLYGNKFAKLLIDYNSKRLKFNTEKIIANDEFTQRNNVVNMRHSFFKDNFEYADNFVIHEFYMPLSSIPEMIKNLVHGILKKNNDNIKINIYYNETVKRITLNSSGHLSVDSDTIHRNYDYVISTVPLNKIFYLLPFLNEKYLHKGNELVTIPMLITAIALDKNTVFPVNDNLQRIFYFDKDIIFNRISFSYFCNRHRMENNRLAFVDTTLDTAFSKKDMTTYIAAYELQIIEDLRKVNLISGSIYRIKSVFLPNAYMIFTVNVTNTRKELISVLNKNNIFQLGSFATWKYQNIDQVIVDAKKLAKKIHDRGVNDDKKTN